MGAQTEIGWCDHTFNPWWGCEKVSPGCTNCYAEAWAKRTGHSLWGSSRRRFFGDKHWREPLAWNRTARDLGVRHRVFCASMADVFEIAPGLDEQRIRLWKLIDATPHLDWLLLTKRPENIHGMIHAALLKRENVWIGASIEDQERADERVPKLLRVPARVRFLSCEPLLEPILLRREWLMSASWKCVVGFDDIGPKTGDSGTMGINWVIVGGESGHHARPCDVDWIRSVVKQCKAAGVPAFCKQMGAHVIDRNDVGFDGGAPDKWPDGTDYGASERFQGATCRVKLLDAKGADPSEWPADLRVQEFPT